MKSIAYLFIGFFFAVLSHTEAKAGCKNIGLNELRMQVTATDLGQVAKIIIPGASADRSTIAVNAENWSLGVDRIEDEISVRFIADGQSIEILNGSLQKNKGASSIFDLQADSRVGQVQVTVCDGESPGSTGRILSQAETAKLTFNITDLKVQLTFNYERRFKPEALTPKGTGSQESSQVSFVQL